MAEVHIITMSKSLLWGLKPKYNVYVSSHVNNNRNKPYIDQRFVIVNVPNIWNFPD